MKRWICALLAALCLGLCGCGNYEKALETARADGYDEGYYYGYEEGYKNGYDEGFDDGIEEAAPAAYDGDGLVWQETPGSDCFAWIGYDEGGEVLAVIFRNNTERLYLYREFPAEQWEAFTGADSLGSWYNEHIKGQYESERVDDVSLYGPKFEA